MRVVIEIAVKVGRLLPTYDPLRHKMMFLLHCGIVSMGARILPTLGPVFTGLVNSMTISSANDVQRLVHQLVAKHGVRRMLCGSSCLPFPRLCFVS